MPSLQATVKGDVQGVGFRYFIERRAREMGLGGWVRNRADGAVELHAEGSRAALERLLAHLRTGPGLARVETVETAWGEETGFDEFSIRP